MSKFIKFPSVNLNKETAIVFIIIFSAAIVFDSTIVRYFSYSDVSFSFSSNFWIFIGLFVLYMIGNIVMLGSVEKLKSASISHISIEKKYFQIIIFSTQILSAALIVTIIIEMTFLQKYNILLLYAITYLTHFSALFFLGVLTLVFINWFRSKKNHILLLYSMAFMTVSTSVIISFVYLHLYFSSWFSTDVRPYPIELLVTQILPSPWNDPLGMAFDILSICSFFLTWAATITLLYQYRYKIGKIKYLILVSAPLIYYLFPFAEHLGNIFAPFALNSPVIFGVTFTIAFSGTKQIGALLFSIAFWAASTLVANDRVRKSLLISAIGMTILFGSIAITSLKYAPFPPYGLITETFMPLGSYLMFLGIFASARFIAQDAELRKEFHKSAKSQLSLLSSIGATQMEKELVKKFKSMEKHAIKTGKTEESYREEDDVKQLIREVMDELNKTRNKE